MSWYIPIYIYFTLILFHYYDLLYNKIYFITFTISILLILFSTYAKTALVIQSYSLNSSFIESISSKINHLTSSISFLSNFILQSINFVANITLLQVSLAKILFPISKTPVSSTLQPHSSYTSLLAPSKIVSLASKCPAGIFHLPLHFSCASYTSKNFPFFSITPPTIIVPITNPS